MKSREMVPCGKQMIRRLAGLMDCVVLPIVAFAALALVAGCARSKEAGKPAEASAPAAPEPNSALVASVAPEAPAVPTSVPEATGPMRVGEARSFTAGGGGEPFLGEGWSPAGGMMTWSIAPVATMKIQVETAGAPLRLRMQTHPFTAPPSLPLQRVTAVIGGETQYSWEMGKAAYLVIPVPGRATERGSVDIQFSLPDCRSPAELGLSTDGRKLAIAVYGVRVEEFPVLEPPYLVKFGTNGNSGPYQIEGWGPPEGDGAWTVRKHASLAIPLPLDRSFGAIRLTISPYVPTGRSYIPELILRVDGGQAKRWIFSSTSTFEYVLSDVQFHDGLCRLDFEVPHAIPPTGSSTDDPRRLGMSVESIGFIPKID
jgi:hypothetical protein